MFLVQLLDQLDAAGIGQAQVHYGQVEFAAVYKAGQFAAGTGLRGTSSYTATTTTVPDSDVDKFDVAIGTEAGSIGVKDASGEPIKVANADGTTVTTGITELGNGYSTVTYATVTTSPVSFSVADTLDTVMPKLVPLTLVLLLYFLFAKKGFTPIKGIVLILVIGIVGAFPLNEWFGIEWWTGLW